MKKELLITLILVSFGISYGQNYSNKNTEYYVKELTRIVIDSSYSDYKTGKILDKPRAEYWVSDNLTSHIFSNDPDYSDNKTYSYFQKIYKKGTVSDFEKMTESKNPSIRLYGFWALIKNKKYRKAKSVIERESEYSDEVFWNSMGCDVSPIAVSELMIELMNRMKKYGS